MNKNRIIIHWDKDSFKIVLSRISYSTRGRKSTNQQNVLRTRLCICTFARVHLCARWNGKNLL